MSLREAAKDRKRERILSSATRLFVADGFAGTTIREIAREARVATGTIFNYAPDKQGLLALVFCREVRAVHDSVAEDIAPDAPFERQLMTLFAAYYRFYGRNPELSRVFLKELMFSSQRLPHVATATQRFLASIVELTSAGQERSELRRDVEPERAAGILFSIYWSCLLAWLGGAIASEAEALAELERSLLLTLDGLRERAQSPR